MSRIYPQHAKELTYSGELIKAGKHQAAIAQLNSLKPETMPVHDKAFYMYLLASVYSKTNQEDKAYHRYLKAQRLYLSIDSVSRVMEINLDVAYMLSAQENSPSDYRRYIHQYMAYAERTHNLVYLAKGNSFLAMVEIDKKKYPEALKLYKKALGLAEPAHDAKLRSTINTNLSSLYIEYLQKPDSALYYLQKDLTYLKQHGTADELCYSYANHAAACYYKGEYEKAVEYLTLASKLPIKDYAPKTRQYLNYFLSQNYEALKDYDNAYKYLQVSNKYADSVNVLDQNIAINDIQTKYRTREKELENSLLKSNIKTNRVLLYTSVGLLAASIAIALLIVKNSRRKVKISRQEKLIEQQKLEKALKEYEINSIDMMLEGQEKERQRIANDLHDNLGSMLATLKLNFENLKLRNDDLQVEETRLFERTDMLIEEAYQKVRQIAHAKNAGVLANEGLIPAVKKLAEKISIPDRLQVDLVAFGFEDRIENNLEIAIFRMVQELATNIIKHAAATEATIHLTNHDNNINIIVEDNGTGFTTGNIEEAGGMGLSSITKKTEQLGGALTIDTTPGRGTTIIIDIPV